MSLSFLGMIILVAIAIAVVVFFITILELTSMFLTGIGGVFTLLLLLAVGWIYVNVNPRNVIHQEARAVAVREEDSGETIPRPSLTQSPELADQSDLAHRPPSPEKPELLAPAPLPRIGDETPLAIRVVTRNSSGVVISGGNVSDIPEWVLNHSRSGHPQWNSQSTVLMSQRFSTLEEARQQNLSQLLMLLRRELHGEFPLFLHKGLTVKDLEQSGIIRQECEILWPIKIGEFEETVHELYWQIDLNTKSKEQLLAACRPVVVKARLIRLTGVVILASLIFTAAAIYFRPARSG